MGQCPPPAGPGGGGISLVMFQREIPRPSGLLERKSIQKGLGDEGGYRSELFLLYLGKAFTRVQSPLYKPGRSQGPRAPFLVPRASFPFLLSPYDKDFDPFLDGPPLS